MPESLVYVKYIPATLRQQAKANSRPLEFSVSSAKIKLKRENIIDYKNNYKKLESKSAPISLTRDSNVLFIFPTSITPNQMKMNPK